MTQTKQPPENPGRFTLAKSIGLGRKRDAALDTRASGTVTKSRGLKAAKAAAQAHLGATTETSEA